MAENNSENLILNIVCIVLALISLIVGPVTVLHWGLSVDSLFVATISLLLAGVFALNPIIAFLDGSLKQMMKQPETKASEQKAQKPLAAE